MNFLENGLPRQVTNGASEAVMHTCIASVLHFAHCSEPSLLRCATRAFNIRKAVDRRMLDVFPSSEEN